MPFPCHAAKGLDCVFLFDLNCEAVFDSHMPCSAFAMPRSCCTESHFSRPLHSAAWLRHGMCELASADQRRHVGDLPAFGFFQPEFHEVCSQEHTNRLNCRTSSSDVSGYHADFHEGNGTVGELQGHGMGCVN
jgi:hypothetical protein